MNNSLNTAIGQDQEAKRGRGRPKGSNCFAHVRIKDLLTMLSEEATIPVSQIWLRDTMGLLVSKPIVRTITNHYTPQQENTEQEKVQFSIETFEE
jgi:hypothetical protein